MIAVPSLPQILEQSLRAESDTWNPLVLHISDLGYGIGEKCPRQLWLRLRGAERRPDTPGEMLMFEHGKRIHIRLVEMLRPHLPPEWEIESVERAVSLGPIRGSYDVRMFHKREGWELIIDFKSVRGRKFGYLKEADPKDALQVQGYQMAGDSDGGLLFYADREGQNFACQFYVERDDNRVESAMFSIIGIARSAEAPPILEPKLKIAANKGPDSVKLEMPWQCSWCRHIGLSCPGALPPKMRELGIVGHVDGDGNFIPKVKDTEVVSVVETLLDMGGYSPIPF